MGCNHRSQSSNKLPSPNSGTLPATIDLRELSIGPVYHSINQQTTDGNLDTMLDDIFCGKRVPSWERPDSSSDFKSNLLRKFSEEELIEFCSSSIANVEHFVQAKSSMAAGLNKNVAGETAAADDSTTSAATAAATGGFDIALSIEDDKPFGNNTAAEKIDAILASSPIDVADEYDTTTTNNAAVATDDDTRPFPAPATNATISINNDAGLEFDLFDDKCWSTLPSFGFDNSTPTQPADGELAATSPSTTSKSSFDKSAPPCQSSATSIGINAANKPQPLKNSTSINVNSHIDVGLVTCDSPYSINCGTKSQPAQSKTSVGIVTATELPQDKCDNPFSFEEELFAPLESFEDFHSGHGSPPSFAANPLRIQPESAAIDCNGLALQIVPKQSMVSAAAPPVPARLQRPLTGSPPVAPGITRLSTTPPGSTARFSRSSIVALTPTKSATNYKKPIWEMSPSEMSHFLDEAGIQAPMASPNTLSSSHTYRPQSTNSSDIRYSKMPGLESPHYAATELPVKPYTTPVKDRKRQASSPLSAVEPKRANVQSQSSYVVQQRQKPYPMPDILTMGNGFDSDYAWLLEKDAGADADVNACVPGAVNGSGSAYAEDQFATGTSPADRVSTASFIPHPGHATTASYASSFNSPHYAATTTPAPVFNTPRHTITGTPAPIFNNRAATSTPGQAASCNTVPPARGSPTPSPLTNPTTAANQKQWIAICSPATTTNPARPTATFAISPKQWNEMQTSALHQGGMVRLRNGMWCRMVDGRRGVVCLVPVS